MKLSKLSLFGILSTALLYAGCSNPVSVPPAAVNYMQGQTYVYFAQALDKNSGDTVAGSGDTIRSYVLATGISYQGMSNVTEIQNTHTNPPSGSNPMDTTYIAQSNSEYWHYNYGLESINENSAVLTVIGKPVAVGWVLQANFDATSNQGWIAVDTNLSVANFNVNLEDTATEAADSTINIGSGSANTSTSIVSAFTKHSMHNIEVTLSGGKLGNGTTDTYVSSQYGPVLDIVHPALLQSQATPGRKMVLIQVP